jgi:hypothetical protein
MAKTYPLKALWPLLPFEVAPAPLQATLDAYGGGLVKYAVSPDGIWLFSLAQPLTAVESENLTGFHPADLVPKQIDGVVGYFYALLGGAPLLPFPFTKDQLIAFNERTAGLIASCIERGSETDAWIADLEKENPDATELARGIHGGKWPLDLADFLDAKIDDVAKPRFRLADGIEVNASAKALKSAFDEAQHQKDLLKQLGITPDLMKQIDYQKDMEKMLGINLGSLADAVYQQEQKRNQEMLRSAIGHSASATAAETIGRQFASTLGLDTVGNAANAYLQSQSTVRADIERALGGGLGTVADAFRQAQYPQQAELEKFKAMVAGNVADSLAQLDRAGLDAAIGRFHEPTVGEMLALREKELLEKAMAPPEPQERIIEFTPPTFYDHQAAIDRQRASDRRHAIETAVLAEKAVLKVRDEHEAQKQAATPPHTADTLPAASGSPTVSVKSEAVEPSWPLTMPKRFPGYSKPLYDYLKAAHVAGKPCPTVRNVLDDWKLNKPADVAKVVSDGLHYFDANGDTKLADLAAIRKAIERMTT